MRAFLDFRSGGSRRSTWLAPLFVTAFATSAFGQLSPNPSEARGEATEDGGPAPRAANVDAEAQADAGKDASGADGSTGAAPAEAPVGTTAASSGTSAGTGQAAAVGASPLVAASSNAAPSSTASSSATQATVEESSAAKGVAEADVAEKEPVAAKPTSAEPKPDYAALPWTYHQKHLDLAVGLAFYHTADTALIPFLEAPVLVEGLVRGGGVLLSSGGFSLAALAEFGGSQGSSNARFIDTSIRFLHITAGVEPRIHLHPRVFLYGRVMAGSEQSTAKLGYDGSSEQLSDSSWVFRVDGNLGAAVRLAGSPDGRKRALRLWAFLEGGYRYTTDHRAELAAEDEDAPPRPEDLSIEPYSSRGARGSVGLMTSF